MPDARGLPRASGDRAGVRRSGGARARADARQAEPHPHRGSDIFAGLPSPFEATRYHSLIVDRATMPDDAGARPPGPRTGWSWACATARLPVFGVQFHPESIASQHGHELLANFLAIARGANQPGAAPPDPFERRRRVQQPQAGAWPGSPIGETLSEDEAEEAFGIIMSGEATPAQIAGLLMAMRVRGETVAELTGAVRAMRARMTRIEAPPDAIDVCGTGGDGAGTLNVSTAVTFVLAGCGVPVAKHGNRALSSRTGGADVLAALGVNVDVPLDRLPAILRAANCVFLFAPRHHAALRHAAGPRVELGTRTIFNLLGPLANPGRGAPAAHRRVRPRVGAADGGDAGAAGHRPAWIVHGAGTGRADRRGREPRRRVARAARCTSVRRNAGGCRAAARAGHSDPGRRRRRERRRTDGVVAGSRGPYRDTVLLNAAAALDRRRPGGRSAGGCRAGGNGARLRRRLRRIGHCGARRARTTALERDEPRADAGQADGCRRPHGQQPS